MGRKKNVVPLKAQENETASASQAESSITSKNSTTTTCATIISVQATKTIARQRLNQPATNNKVIFEVDTNVVQQSSKNIFQCPCSYVKHTADWIPGNFGLRRDVAIAKKNGSYMTSDCGKFDQLLEQSSSFTSPCFLRMRCQCIVKGAFVITLPNVQYTCSQHKSRCKV